MQCAHLKDPINIKQTAGAARAAAAGVPAVLETTNPDNVAMYERSGWRITTELQDVIGLTVWILRHD